MLIPLRNYSNYSICESNIKIQDLVDFAIDKDLTAIALTDYKLLSGVLEFSTKLQKKGIQPIIGIDIDFINSMGNLCRLTLIAKNQDGYKNLCTLSTKINTENNFTISIANIDEYSNGNILILGGLYSYFYELSINEKNLKEAKAEIKKLKNIFNNDIFFEYDYNLNNSLLNQISIDLKILTFLSSFSFYKNDHDFKSMQILHCVKNGEYLQNSSFKITNNYSLNYKEVISDNKYSILKENCQLIANKIQFLLEEKPISLPNFTSDLNNNEDKELIKQARSGLDLRLKKIFKGIQERIQEDKHCA